MKRKSVQFLLTLLLVIISATVVGNGDNPQTRPFMGSMNGEAIFDFDFDSSPCLSVTGAPWQTVSSMEGKLTHLGRSEYYSTHCSTLDGTQLVNGEATLVAANGDEVWLSYTANLLGTFPAPVLVYVVDNVVVGGTGRFEGASGKFLIIAIVTLGEVPDPTAPAPLEMNFAGNITY